MKPDPRVPLALFLCCAPACQSTGKMCGAGTHAEGDYCVADTGEGEGDAETGDAETGVDSASDTDSRTDTGTDAVATIDVDLLIDAECGVAGDMVTADILDACTHGERLGTWKVSDRSTLQISADEMATLATFNVQGAPYNDIGSTRAFSFPNAGVNDSNYAQLTFDPPIDGDLSFGAWWSSPPDNSTWVTLDQVFFENAAGDWVVAQTQTNELCMHTRAGVGDSIPFEYDTWYWLTFTVLRDATVTLSLYDTSAVLVGTSTLDNPGTTAWRDLRFGRTDSHANGAAMDGEIRFDDLVLDTTDHSFPLGPE